MNPDSPPTTARESAPYGRACLGCSKAKCRCILRGDGLRCERCHRLRRECHPSTVVRKRLARRPANRTRELEDKLDSLVTLLRTQAPTASRESEGSEQSPDSRLSGYDAAGGGSENPGHGENGRVRAGAPRQAQNGDVSKTCGDPTGFYFTPQTAASPPFTPELSPSQAESTFQKFLNTHICNFPFIQFSTSTSAAQLQAQWPFLWLNIRANCTSSIAERRVLEIKIREVASQKLLVELERSMDLLLGMIAYLSWTSEKFKGKPLLSTFSHITMSLLSDLRIDKPVSEFPCRELSVCKAYSYPIKQIVPAVHRTNEERRAVLGCFVSCATCTWFLKTKPFGWTPHMEDCVRYLMENPESQGDWILVTQARLSKILEDLNSAASWRPTSTLPVQSSYPPALMHVKALRGNIKDIKETTPAETLKDKRVVSYLLATEAMVNELPLYPMDQTTSPLGCVDFERTECFYTCLQAIKGCLDNFFSFTPDETLGHPMPVHLHFSRCTHILYRLSLMDDPAWDRGAISSAVDLLGAMEECAQRYEAVPRQVGLETDGSDIFTRAAEVLRNTVPLWRRGLEEAGAIPTAAPEQQTEPPVLEGEMTAMDLSVDGWFTDIFSMYDTY